MASGLLNNTVGWNIDASLRNSFISHLIERLWETNSIFGRLRDINRNFGVNGSWTSYPWNNSVIDAPANKLVLCWQRGKQHDNILKCSNKLFQANRGWASNFYRHFHLLTPIIIIWNLGILSSEANKLLIIWALHHAGGRCRTPITNWGQTFSIRRYIIYRTSQNRWRNAPFPSNDGLNIIKCYKPCHLQVFKHD